MTKRLFATGLLALLLLVWAAPAARAVPRPTTRTVVLILAPYLRWDDVLSGEMPETARLARDGAVADMNVRSLLPDPGYDSVEAGALMISAGTWARHDVEARGPSQEESGTPAIRYPGLAQDERANAGEDVDIRLGTLGQAVADAGGVTAAFGNADALDLRSRPAALVAMDASGNVTYGDVSSRVTRSSATSDGVDVVSDGGAIVARLGALLALRTGSRTPALVVIDPGDLERVYFEAGGEPEGPYAAGRTRALRTLDTLVASVHSRLPADAVLVVAAPVASAKSGALPGFAPLIVSGDGWSGYLTSGSTHRTGIVTSADLTAGILTLFGIAPPVQVAGSPLEVRPGGSDRLLALGRVDTFMRSVDDVRGRVVQALILLVALVMAASLALAGAERAPGGAVRAALLALLALASVPVASLLMFVPLALPQTPALVAALLLGATAVVFAAAALALRFAPRPRELALLALLTGLVILGDQWLGAPLSLDGLFSYSPLVGARYYGIGNETAALLVGAVLTGLALVADALPNDGSRRRLVRWAFPAAGVLCVLTAAAPFLGANIGVTVWGLFAFGLAWAGMMGRKVGWRTVVALLLAVALVVVALVAVDLATGPRTHLGRSVVTGVRGGAGELGTIVARKAATNVRILVSSDFSLLFFALALALAYARWRPRGAFRDMLDEHPAFAAALSAVIVAGVVAYFTEDSGIVVPALLLFFPTLAVVYLMLAGRLEGGERA